MYLHLYIIFFIKIFTFYYIFKENVQPTYSQVGTTLHQSLTEDEQIKIAKRIGIVQHLPISQYTNENFQSKKVPSECDICMNDFVVGM